MKSQVLSQFDMTIFPIIGFIIFVSVFIGIVWFVKRQDNQEDFERSSFLPLHDGHKIQGKQYE